jgi:hypothetical protein
MSIIAMRSMAVTPARRFTTTSAISRAATSSRTAGIATSELHMIGRAGGSWPRWIHLGRVPLALAVVTANLLDVPRQAEHWFYG